MGKTGSTRFSQETLTTGIEEMYKTSERPIPAALVDSDEFRNLNQAQQQNFSARLYYIEEICLKSQEWLQFREGFESLSSFIDEIELDLLINIGNDEKDSSISPWLIHSSWTFNTSAQCMLDCVSDCLTCDAVEVDIGFNCDELEFSDWLKKHIDCIRLLLDKFYVAHSFDCAIGNLIAIDICMITLLSGVLKQRFNIKLMD